MSSPFSTVDAGIAAPQPLDESDGSESDIPKRMMRVKVLYTFDDDNKTNCLARLPNALPIPVVALDETTQIGVMELKICIQAIVASSPELIAKLEHDYTVYAYDYSEYETPLVGQGMLSWVLASASPTPSAPASQSQTMITGRVCKNILGLFSSNGIKETLEVKLKLVPVPTRSKNEFLQNMAVYRNPSVVMPDGFDNHAWNSFLQAIPNTGVMEGTQTSQGPPVAGGRGQLTRSGTGGVEQLHDMLTPKFTQDDDGYSIGHHSSRGGSPAVSHHSFSAQQPIYDGSRPASRVGMHGQQQQQQQNEYAIDDQSFEDGPARKRARLQQADWNGRGSFGTTADSLRVAVSTSASLRGFRPGSIAGNSSAGQDMVPRAPTPRAGEKRGGRPLVQNRMSNLRRESSASYTNSLNQTDPGMRTDSGIFSLDDDAGSSLFSSPSPNLPSSPPEYTPIEDSFPPSSPGLPELPLPTDSGFQSDFFTDLPSEQPRQRGAQIKQHIASMNKHQQRQKDGSIEFMHVEPGPRSDLPGMSFPQFDPVSQRAARASLCRKSNDQNALSSPTRQPAQRRGGHAANTAPPSRQQSMTPLQMDAPSPNNPMQSIEIQTESNSPLDTTNGANDMQPPAVRASAPAQPIAQPRPHGWSTKPLPAQPVEIPEESQQGTSMTGFPPRNAQSRQGQWSRPSQHGIKRSMSRTQSWAAGGGSSDIESDGPTADNGPKSSRPRNGSGVVRMKAIDSQLQNAVATGAPVKFCRNCGEIKTSTWRPYWTRAYDGDGSAFEINVKMGIHYIESLATDATGRTTRYRIYKQYSHLTSEEKTAGIYEQLIFCNPCGDYIRKYSAIRPREIWDPTLKPAKKQRRPRKMKQPGQFTSDAVAPSSDWDMPPSHNRPRFSDMQNFTDPFLPSEGPMPPQSMAPTPSVQRPTAGPMSQTAPQPQQNQHGAQQASQGGCDAWDADALEVALEKAIQSSPARLLGSQTSPIEIAEESPNPTRRLLFPSPRKEGEFKSLADPPEGEKSRDTTPTRSQPRQQKTKMPTKTLTPPLETEEVDKENLPPAEDEEDDFAHLFDDTLLSGTPVPVTPRTERTIARLFKTPTPVKPRTPRTGHGSRRSRTSHLLETPTRSSSGGVRRSPRFSGRTSGGSRRVETLMEQQQLTPISASLNQLLSEAIRSSPGNKNFGWSPGKLFGGDLGNMNFQAEFPMPSSPPQFSGDLHGSGGVGGGLNGGVGLDGFEGAELLDLPVFEMWEDGTATDPVKGWEDFLASDAGIGDAFEHSLGDMGVEGTVVVEIEVVKVVLDETMGGSGDGDKEMGERVREMVATEVEKSDEAMGVEKATE